MFTVDSSRQLVSSDSSGLLRMCRPAGEAAAHLAALKSEDREHVSDSAALGGLRARHPAVSGAVCARACVPGADLLHGPLHLVRKDLRLMLMLLRMMLMLHLLLLLLLLLMLLLLPLLL